MLDWGLFLPSIILPTSSVSFQKMGMLGRRAGKHIGRAFQRVPGSACTQCVSYNLIEKAKTESGIPKQNHFHTAAVHGPPGWHTNTRWLSKLCNKCVFMFVCCALMENMSFCSAACAASAIRTHICTEHALLALLLSLLLTHLPFTLGIRAFSSLFFSRAGVSDLLLDCLHYLLFGFFFVCHTSLSLLIIRACNFILSCFTPSLVLSLIPCSSPSLSYLRPSLWCMCVCFSVCRCRMCGLTFCSKSDMQLHSKSHTEVKAHQCPHCSKSFANTSYLAQHIRIHSGAKPYTCSYCQKAFRQLSHLQQHTRYSEPHLKCVCLCVGVCGEAGGWWRVYVMDFLCGDRTGKGKDGALECMCTCVCALTDTCVLKHWALKWSVFSSYDKFMYTCAVCLSSCSSVGRVLP